MICGAALVRRDESSGAIWCDERKVTTRPGRATICVSCRRFPLSAPKSLTHHFRHTTQAAPQLSSNLLKSRPTNFFLSHRTEPRATIIVFIFSITSSLSSPCFKPRQDYCFISSSRVTTFVSPHQAAATIIVPPRQAAPVISSHCTKPRHHSRLAPSNSRRHFFILPHQAAPQLSSRLLKSRHHFHLVAPKNCLKTFFLASLICAPISSCNFAKLHINLGSMPRKTIAV
jgi:hypothetical protein